MSRPRGPTGPSSAAACPKRIVSLPTPGSANARDMVASEKQRRPDKRQMTRAANARYFISAYPQTFTIHSRRELLVASQGR
jgi:hypothetical protein